MHLSRFRSVRFLAFAASVLASAATVRAQFNATADAYFWDNNAHRPDRWESGGASNNWVGNSLPPSRANIVFNDAYVDRNQAIALNEDRTVGSLTFSGEHAYAINGYRRLTFDAVSGASRLTLAPSTTGNASHALNVDIALSNDLVVDNQVANQTLTFGDTVDLNGRNLTVGGAGNTVFASTVDSGASVTKLGSGVLEFEGTALVHNMTLAGGTLSLESSLLFGAGTLNITGDSIIDFGTGSGSALGFGNLLIDAGVTLTINNWTDAIDYFVTMNMPSAGTLSQIVFAGFNGPAGWDTFTKQIRPVPEPATYGLMLGGLALFGFGAVRWRERRKAAPSR